MVLNITITAMMSGQKMFLCIVYSQTLAFVLRGGLVVGRWTCNLQVADSIPAGPLSLNSALHPSGVAKSSTCFGWG